MTRQIADLFNSYMNEAAIEQQGLTNVKPHLDAIAAIKDKKELAHALGESMRADVDALNNTNFHTPNIFGLWTAPGFNDSDHYAAYLLQGGLELPDREYYLADSPHMRDIRSEYQKHISEMLKLAGFTDTDARAARIVELEHAIAEKHNSFPTMTTSTKPTTPGSRRTSPPKLRAWIGRSFSSGAGLDKQQEFTVWQPTAFTGESALVESVPLENWKDWLAFHLMEDYASVPPKAFAEEHFNFVGKQLFGVPQQRPRWERGVGVVDGMLGDAVGKVYAQRYFSPEAKAKAQAMVANHRCGVS